MICIPETTSASIPTPTGTGTTGTASAEPLTAGTTAGAKATDQEPSQATETCPSATPSSSSPSRVAVVLAPGGLPGLEAHLGAWKAIEEAGIRPTQICGCSAGAIIGAIWAAGRLDAQDTIDFISQLRTDDVVKKRWLWKASLFYMQYFCDPAPIAGLLETLLPEEFEALHTPLRISAHRMLPVQEPAWFQHGPWLREAVQASAAIAGVWPYVQIGDTGSYSDGGTCDALVLPRGVLTYDRVIVLNICRFQPFEKRDHNVVSRLLWNVEALQDKEWDAQHAWLARNLGVRRLTWINLDIGSQSCLAFSPDHRLIASAYEAVRGVLQPRMKGSAT